MPLTPWEVETMRHLSATYINDSHMMSKDANILPPYITERTEKMLTDDYVKRRLARLGLVT